MSFKPYLKYWKKHQFKAVVIGSIILISVLYATKGRTDGTWSLEYDWIPSHMRGSRRAPAFARNSRGEVECRRVIEGIFGRPFPNTRPAFLMNGITGKPLEIDCCNTELMLGVEYNGRQHYQFTPGMHKNREAFRLQQYRDDMKLRKCREAGFDLIVVPYTVRFNDIETFIRDELRRMGRD